MSILDGKVLSRGTLRDFWEKYPEVERQFKVWYADVLAAKWQSPADVKRQYATASILENGRIVFNIRGNSFRPSLNLTSKGKRSISVSLAHTKNMIKLTLIQFDYAETNQDGGRV